ncbi:MAG: hypothetical protein A2X23_10555 [Chloroflexi bacterium GWC2_73_18]|nr:MAG: hypothetical protein A2X23_10555 [Chloroflexi bacterium GWC2_73_18]
MALVLSVATVLLAACAATAPTPTPSPTPAPSPGATPTGPVPPLWTPQPGQPNRHPVAADTLDAWADGDHIVARLTWSSGVEPCYVFDSVLIAEDGTTITLTIVEGGDPGAICVKLLVQKVTQVDLGEFDPGTYTIRAVPGTAPPVAVTVG